MKWGVRPHDFVSLGHFTGSAHPSSIPRPTFIRPSKRSLLLYPPFPDMSVSPASNVTRTGSQALPLPLPVTQRLLQAYLQRLVSNPLLTKSITLGQLQPVLFFFAGQELLCSLLFSLLLDRPCFSHSTFLLPDVPSRISGLSSYLTAFPKPALSYYLQAVISTYLARPAPSVNKVEAEAKSFLAASSSEKVHRVSRVACAVSKEATDKKALLMAAYGGLISGPVSPMNSRMV